MILTRKSMINICSDMRDYINEIRTEGNIHRTKQNYKQINEERALKIKVKIDSCNEKLTLERENKIMKLSKKLSKIKRRKIRRKG